MVRWPQRHSLASRVWVQRQQGWIWRRRGEIQRLPRPLRCGGQGTTPSLSEAAVAGEFTKATSRLDFSASVTPVEYLTVTIDATNLTGVPFQNVRNFSDTQSYPRDVRYEARTFSLGARFRF